MIWGLVWNARTTAAVALVCFAAGATGGWTVNGWRLGKNLEELKADIEAQKATASEAARKEERTKQEKVNNALREQNETLAGINARLDRDLARLRNRPERPASVSEAPRASCEGANGTELGRLYAEFLTRFAARAAIQDEALKTCYAVLDSAYSPNSAITDSTMPKP